MANFRITSETVWSVRGAPLAPEVALRLAVATTDSTWGTTNKATIDANIAALFAGYSAGSTWASRMAAVRAAIAEADARRRVVWAALEAALTDARMIELVVCDETIRRLNENPGLIA